MRILELRRHLQVAQTQRSQHASEHRVVRKVGIEAAIHRKRACLCVECRILRRLRPSIPRRACQTAHKLVEPAKTHRRAYRIARAIVVVKALIPHILVRTPFVFGEQRAKVAASIRHGVVRTELLHAIHDLRRELRAMHMGLQTLSLIHI